MSINLTDELLAKTKKGKIASAKQVFLEGDKENLQQIGDKTHQLEDAFKDVTVSGGASTANAVSYNNETSGMTAVTAQGAIDELATKNKAQDAIIETKAEKSEVATELDKKFDKENIAQEFGDSENKVVSQFALPFREIESPEFIKAIVDAEDHFLFGIQLDGSIEWGKGIPAPIRAKLQEIINQCQQDKTDLLESISTLNSILNKTTIKDEEGTVVETPFRYIQNEEFIFAKVDAEDKLLFGIQWDGTPVFGKTSAVEDRLQSQVNLLADKIRNILGDDNTTSAIDTLKELKDFFAGIDNTQTLTSILANLDKTTIKDEEGNVQDTPFRVIENEEFIMAVVDSEDRLLFGIYRATGKPYYPLNEMYHVEQNEEFFAAWVTTNDKVVLGLRRDGEVIGEIHAVNALKQVIFQLQSDLASLQEKVGTIDTNLKELLDVFSLQDNEEYLAVEQDAEGKVLSSTNLDGSHYIHNAKSETIPTEFSHIEDPEGRTEITTDAENKILGYRDSEGTRHEHKISANHINLSDEAAKEVNEAFKSAGIKMENPSDFSKDSYIELPIPRIEAEVRLYAPKLPTTKQDDIEAEIEYNDKDGNYFRKPVILNAQGSSSMMYYVKNMAIDIADGSEIKFGDFPTQDSFHLKKYYIDIFRGQCIVGYHLMEQVYKSRPIGKQYPYELLQENESTISGYGDIKKDFFTGAKCHPDGFPINITWVNTETNEEKDMGIYTLNLKKSKEVYGMDKKNTKHIHLDGVIDNSTLFGGNINWSSFEIRNPKSLKDVDGNKYDGDNPKELSETDSFSKQVKDAIVRLSGINSSLKSNNTKETYETYLLVNPTIDYLLVSELIYNYDGFQKNWQWCTYDAQHWCPNLYDVDAIFGSYAFGYKIIPNSENERHFPIFNLQNVYKEEIKARYAELRKSGIFSVDNVIALFNDWTERIGYNGYSKEIKLYPETPSYRDPKLNNQWAMGYKIVTSDVEDYSETKQYNEGDYCLYQDYLFVAKQNVIGIPPVFDSYKNYPNLGGYYNSIGRIKNWLTKRIIYLDTYYNYNEV